MDEISLVTTRVHLSARSVISNTTTIATHWGFRLVFISQILGKYRNKHVLNSYNLWIQCIRENIDNAANGDDQNMILSFGIFDQKTVTILYVFISIFTRYLG